MEKFVITEFGGAFISRDEKGRKIRFIERKFACFIVTLSGKIKFSSEEGSAVSDTNTAVFLPNGLTYVNECLESAESYVFNFNASLNCAKPLSLSTVDRNFVSDCFEEINLYAAQNTISSEAGILKKLYSLAEKLFDEHKDLNNSIIDKALVYMRKNYMNFDLKVKDIAEYCAISEIYLHKLFKKYLDKTPYKVLTEIRMRKAEMMVEEKRLLKEIASNVGYVDIYQFSRAYKKFFGYAPTMKSGD